MNSYFIAIEGPSGSGKSTLTDHLSKYLKTRGSVYQSWQPSKYFDKNNENNLKGNELANLFIQDRVKQMEEEFNPAFEKYDFVITDRYIPSTLVYQSIEGLDLDWLYNQNIQFRVPDLTVFLEADIETLTTRVESREQISRFEQREFRVKEVNTYSIVYTYLKKKNWNCVIVNSNKDIELIKRNVILNLTS
jgi:dTMP kinase